VTDAAEPVVARRARAGRRRRVRERAPSDAHPLTPYLWIAPAVAVFATFTLAPLIHTVYLSFYDWDGITPGTWTGFGNYRAIFTDPQLRATFLHPLVMVLFYCVIPVTLALAVTGMVVRMRVRGLGFYRGVLFLPQVIATVAVALAWRNIYDPDGPLNDVLRAVGLDGVARPWLGDFTWALWALGFVGTWITFGFCLVLFIAGAQKIPSELFDAARVDGAPAWHEFLAVTLPGLRREIGFAVILTLIAALRTFDINYVLTQGGPGLSTSVPSYEVYRQAFVSGHVGRAAAFGVALTVIIMAVVVPLARYQAREDR
jgi:raffinose/stachyose/melibiose transport system permease protein